MSSHPEISRIRTSVYLERREEHNSTCSTKSNKGITKMMNQHFIFIQVELTLVFNVKGNKLTFKVKVRLLEIYSFIMIPN